MGALLAPDRGGPASITVACSPQKADWFLGHRQGTCLRWIRPRDMNYGAFFLEAAPMPPDLIHRGRTTGYRRVLRSGGVHVRVGRAIVSVIAEANPTRHHGSKSSAGGQRCQDFGSKSSRVSVCCHAAPLVPSLQNGLRYMYLGVILSVTVNLFVAVERASIH